MLKIFPPMYRRRKLRLNSTSIPEPVGNLQLLSATLLDFSGADALVKLVFDTTESDPLMNLAAAAPAQWTATINGYAFVGNTLEESSFAIVLLYLGNAGEALGANVINYAADPSDILDASGRALPALSGVPLEE